MCSTMSRLMKLPVKNIVDLRFYAWPNIKKILSLPLTPNAVTVVMSSSPASTMKGSVVSIPDAFS